jgi:hypothetical protein
VRTAARFGVVGALALSTTVAAADEPSPESSLRYTNTLGAQANPRMLADDFRIRYRHRLYHREGALFEQSFVGGFAGVAVGAAGLRPIVGLELQPLSVLTLGVSYGPTVYFGAFGLAQSYPSPRSDYSSGVVAAPKDGPGGSQSLVAHQVTMSASLQAKIGPLFLRNAARGMYVHVNVFDGDRVVYDPVADVTVYRRGWALQNDSEVGYFFGKRFVAGMRHTLVVAWYPSGAFAAGEAREVHDSPTSRLGPIASYTLFEGRGGAVDSAAVAGVAQWYIAHRFRTGEVTPAAMPLVGVALSLTGDL